MGGGGRFVVGRRCAGVTPHLCVGSELSYERDPSSVLIKARRGKRERIRVIETTIVKHSAVALGTPNTADVNKVIYWCHLEQIGPEGASLFASSLAIREGIHYPVYLCC